MTRGKTEGWELTPHVCRSCFGRVLRREESEDVGYVHLCANCGATGLDSSPRVICACGIRLKTGGNAGIRCQANANPSPEFPSLFVAVQVEQASRK